MILGQRYSYKNEVTRKDQMEFKIKRQSTGSHQGKDQHCVTCTCLHASQCAIPCLLRGKSWAKTDCYYHLIGHLQRYIYNRVDVRIIKCTQTKSLPTANQHYFVILQCMTCKDLCDTPDQCNCNILHFVLRFMNCPPWKQTAKPTVVVDLHH